MKKNTVIVQQAEKEIGFPIETVVVAVGVLSNRELPDVLHESDLEFYVIGDA
jgi:hypothetical protein